VVKTFLKNALNLGDLTKQVTRQTKIWWGAVKNVTKTVLTDDGKLLDKTYSDWVTYAKAVNKKVYEVFDKLITTYTNDIRGWNYYNKQQSSALDALKYKAKYLKDDFSDLANTLHITGITTENFVQRYKKAIQSTLTPDELKSWHTLSDALKKATVAQEEYRKAYLASAKKEVGYKEYIINATKSIATTIYQAIYDELEAINNYANSLRDITKSSTALIDTLATKK